MIARRGRASVIAAGVVAALATACGASRGTPHDTTPEAHATAADARTAEAHTAEAPTAEARESASETSTPETSTPETSTPETPDAVSSDTAPPPGMVVSLAADIGALERRLGELDAFVALLDRVRAQSALDEDAELPPICGDGELIEALRVSGSSGASRATSRHDLVLAIRGYCEPLERWAQPDVEAEVRIQAYTRMVDRVAASLEALVPCASPPCDRELLESVRRARSLLAAHARELEPVRRGGRVACTTETLAQIEAVRWPSPIHQSRIDQLPRAALNLCGELEVLPSQRLARRGVLASELDRVERGVRAERRTSLEALTALRAYVRP